jgi:hypothetical protein
MGTVSVLLAIIVVVLLYIGNRFLRDARAIRKELSDGRTLRDLDDMVEETRDKLLADYDSVTSGLDKRTEKLERLNREAGTMISRLEGLLNSERLKTLEERGIIFAIEAGEKSGKQEGDKNKRIAELLRGGASIEEVARITESSVREVELIRLLIKRREEVSGT